MYRSLNDVELIESATESDKLQSDQCDSESSEDESEKISTESLIDILDKAIKGLEQRSYISENEIKSVYRIKEKVLKHKFKLRQKPLLDMLT